MAAISQSFELRPLEGATSAVWNHFGFRAIDGQFVTKLKKYRKEVYCKLCSKVSLFCLRCTHWLHENTSVLTVFN